MMKHNSILLSQNVAAVAIYNILVFFLFSTCSRLARLFVTDKIFLTTFFLPKLLLVGHIFCGHDFQ